MPAAEVFQDRDSYRVILLTELSVEHETHFKVTSLTKHSASRVLDFGRLSTYVDLDKTVLPMELELPDTVSLDCKGLEGEEYVSATKIHFWENSTNTSKVLMLDISVSIRIEFEKFIKFLDQVFEGKKILKADRIYIDTKDCNDLVTQYCLVSMPTQDEKLPFDIQQKVIYRSNYSAVEENVKLVRPPELNRRESTGAVLGPLVGLLWGQQEYIESLAIISTIMVVGAESKLRVVQKNALRLLKTTSNDCLPDDLEQEKHQLINNFTQITQLENTLVMSTDVGSNLFVTVPSLRPADFHHCLYEVLRIKEDRETCERIIQRVKSVNSSRNGQLSAIEARKKSLQSLRWSVSVAIVSVIAVPFSLIFGYFSLKGSEPQPGHLFIDIVFYWKFYIFLVAALIVIVILHLLLYLWHRKEIAEFKKARLILE